MAAAFKASIGNAFLNASGTTLAITTTAAIAIGDTVVVRWAADNLSATTPTATCADGGNTYTVQRQAAANATAAAGIAGGILTSLATVARPSGSTITLTFSGAITGKAAYAETFTNVLGSTRVAAVGSSGTTGTAATSGASAAGILAGDLVLGFSAVQTRVAATGDADTTNGSWSAKFAVIGGGTSGQDGTSVQINGQYKIPTAGGAQTYDNTVTSTYWITGLVVLQGAPDPSITQASYQFFNEGKESTSVGIVAQDTAVSSLDVLANRNIQLRIRLQSTTAVAVNATDDFQLQVERDSSGTWVNVTTSSTNVAGYNSVGLTEGAATTNRLGAGTGSFVAGKTSEDGLVDDLGWTANNYTELLYSLVVKSADVVATTVLKFRVLYNGAVTQMTYTVTPQITVVKSASVPLEGLTLWLDADDASTFTLSGSTVTQWRDKSGGANHFSGGALTRDGVIGSRTSVRYPGLPAAVMTRGGPVQTVTENWAMILVCRRNTAVTQGSDGSIAFINGGGANAAADGYGLGPKSSTSVNYEIGFLIGGVVWFNSSTLDTGLVHIQEVGNVAASIQHYINGVATNRNTGAMNAPITPSTNSSIPSSQVLHGFAGDICEILMYNRALSLAEVLAINTYLTARWIVGGRPKVYTGAAFVAKPLKVWTGSAWVEKPVKVWTGSVWKTVT